MPDKNQHEERGFKGVWIPKEIWLSKELSILEKVLLVEIDSLDNENHCTAGNDYFAEFCNCGTATITRAIAHLKELGLVEELPYNGKYRTLRVIKLISQTNQNDESDSSKRLANNITNNKNNNNSTNVELGQPTASPSTPPKRRVKLVDTPESVSNKDTVREPSRKKNLYEKCLDKIDALIDPKDIELKERLVEYLKVRLERKDIQFGSGGFEGMIKKLLRLADTNTDRLAIVQQAIDRNYPTFYPLSKKSAFKGRQDQRVFSEYGVQTGMKEGEVILNVQF